MSLEKVLNIYAKWLELYINYAKEAGLTEEQLQMVVAQFRPPVSDKDYVFITYCHDDPRNYLEEDIKIISTIDKLKK